MLCAEQVGLWIPFWLSSSIANCGYFPWIGGIASYPFVFAYILMF